MENINIARMIDHTILKPEATEAEIMELCKEAVIQILPILVFRAEILPEV